jgi:hypothetical protein
LKKGPAAFFIDAYFQALDTSSLSLISKVFENISNSNCFQIHIYVRAINALTKPSIDKNNREFYTFEEYEQQVIESLSHFVHKAKNKNLYIHLVNDRNKNPELHNRFFLTKFGALDFGKGFESFDYQTSQIPVHIVDREMHFDLVEWYVNQQATFHDHKIIKI